MGTEKTMMMVYYFNMSPHGDPERRLKEFKESLPKLADEWLVHVIPVWDQQTNVQTICLKQLY